MPQPTLRVRRDRCPGVLRPWPADDGALVRVRLAGGHVTADALAGLARVARDHGDGEVHLTSRANLQLRALPWDGEGLRADVVAAVAATGLLPAPRHDLARNLVCSPLTGIVGGRADLRATTRELDALLCADPDLAQLPGRFLHVLDDGRGDLVDRETDLGAVALDGSTAQLRTGAGWGPVVPLAEVPRCLVDLARRFVARRGVDETAAWHVVELDDPAGLLGPAERRGADPRVPPATAPDWAGLERVGAVHVPAPDGVLTPALVDRLVRAGRDLVVTPWHGVVVTP